MVTSVLFEILQIFGSGTLTERRYALASSSGLTIGFIIAALLSKSLRANAIRLTGQSGSPARNSSFLRYELGGSARCGNGQPNDCPRILGERVEYAGRQPANLEAHCTAETSGSFPQYRPHEGGDRKSVV